MRAASRWRHALESLALRGVRDVVPTYNAVTVHFDPLVTDRRGAQRRARAACRVDRRSHRELRSRRSRNSRDAMAATSGPDLAAVAGVRRMLRGRCRAASRGRRPIACTCSDFSPALRTWGRSIRGSRCRGSIRLGCGSPRARSASPGTQTGIYPCDTPGGWRIIGRTSTKVFDADESRAVSVESWRLREVRRRVSHGCGSRFCVRVCSRPCRTWADGDFSRAACR